MADIFTTMRASVEKYKEEKEVFKKKEEHKLILGELKFSHLTSTMGGRFTITSEFGSVQGYRTGMPFNCGAVILAGIYFNTDSHPLIDDTDVFKKELEELMNLFDYYLPELANMDGSKKNKIIMTDRDRRSKDGKFSLSSMKTIHYYCHTRKWHQGPPTRNENSGYDIFVFETNRPGMDQ